MNIEQIGKFIQERRKLKKLTQSQLAKKINVSEKTVSKWECGYGMPDTSVILSLCRELDITANELLAGKKLSSEEYESSAEENLLNLKKQHEFSNKFLLNLEIVLGSISTFVFLSFIFISMFCNISNTLKVILIVFGIIIFFIGISFCLKIERNIGFYVCSKCNNKYVPKFKNIFWSMHVGRIRYLKCPKCNKFSWSKKSIK